MSDNKLDLYPNMGGTSFIRYGTSHNDTTRSLVKTDIYLDMG